MKKNIQPPTFNLQRPMRSPARRFFGCWMLDVGGWRLIFFTALFATPRLFSQTSTNTLPALAPPYGEIPPTFWERHGTMMLVSSFTVVALAILILWKLLQPKSPVILPPDVLARAALTNLLRQPEDGELLSEVSQIFRRYLIAAFGMPVGELTTTEFCAALAGNEKIGAELAQTISNFSRECDERKFAPVNPYAPFNAAARALELISLVEEATHRQDACATKNERPI